MTSNCPALIFTFNKAFMQKAGTICSSTDLDNPTQQVEGFLFCKGNRTDLTLSSHYYQLLKLLKLYFKSTEEKNMWITDVRRLIYF